MIYTRVLSRRFGGAEPGRPDPWGARGLPRSEATCTGMRGTGVQPDHYGSFSWVHAHVAAREANIIGLQTASLGSGRSTRDPSGLLAETIAETMGWVRQEAGARFDHIELSIAVSIVIAEHRG